MLKVIEAKGDTIEAAVSQALSILGCERDEVSVEVLKNPKSGFLGFGREPAVVKVQYETSPADKAREFLEGFLTRFGTPADITIKENSEEKIIDISLSGDNMGTVIGRRGDTLDAIQYLTGIVANREEKDRWRINVDSENYREKRVGTLESLAIKTAQKALKYKKPVALEPMTAHERRIIHTALQEYDGITTYSTGSDPNRKVIVSPSDMPQQKGGNKNRGKSFNGKPGGRSGGQRRPYHKKATVSTPDTATE